MNVRMADADDAEVIAHLLHDFNTEYGEPTPTPSELADEAARHLYTRGFPAHGG